MSSRKKCPPAHGIAEKAARALELPLEAFVRLPHIELTGNREIVVEGYGGLIEYDENLVRINGGCVEICICGTGLSLSHMTPDAIVVSGTLESLRFI